MASDIHSIAVFMHARVSEACLTNEKSQSLLRLLISAETNRTTLRKYLSLRTPQICTQWKRDTSFNRASAAERSQSERPKRRCWLNSASSVWTHNIPAKLRVARTKVGKVHRCRIVSSEMSFTVLGVEKEYLRQLFEPKRSRIILDDVF